MRKPEIIHEPDGITFRVPKPTEGLPWSVVEKGDGQYIWWVIENKFGDDVCSTGGHIKHSEAAFDAFRDLCMILVTVNGDKAIMADGKKINIQWR